MVPFDNCQILELASRPLKLKDIDVTARGRWLHCLQATYRLMKGLLACNFSICSDDIVSRKVQRGLSTQTS